MNKFNYFLIICLISFCSTIKINKPETIIIGKLKFTGVSCDSKGNCKKLNEETQTFDLNDNGKVLVDGMKLFQYKISNNIL